MSSTDQRSYLFPRLTQVQLEAFSLYSLQPNVCLKLEHGVTCLAGANGIGKSTFLSTINYGLTGAVPHPRRRLLSAQAYYREASDYSSEFFDGRINENDRENAAVTLFFNIGETAVKVTRGLFDPDDVRSFEIDGVEQGVDDGIATPLKRSELYRSVLTKAIGLTSFEQFVFLQHFVFTFDEARHLLFWDEAATAQSVFLCFGGTPDDAANADRLFRQSEKAGSRGRNAQYQVNNIRKRIDAITQSIGITEEKPSDFDDLDSAYQELEEKVEINTKKVERADAELVEAEVHVAKLGAKVANLRAAYADAFNRFLHGKSTPSMHPIVSRAINEGICGICESTGTTVAETVQAHLNDKHCPLCNSVLEGKQGLTAAKTELTSIDVSLNAARVELDNAVATEKRLRQESIAAREKLAATRADLNTFEQRHQSTLDLLRNQKVARTGPLAETLRSLEHTMASFVEQRDRDYSERDRLRDELRALQKVLERRYALAEESFVPRFRKLAGAFLGIDLDVSLQLTNPTGIKLVVELRGNARHDENQMSESQRFFVDIALRMALAQQMSSQTSLASLFIDTPEGSLDIAYEDRAGNMFAKFVKTGHDMIMTANINSSKLLTTLASHCGAENMTLNPMTGWTELSEVQQSATSLFQEAYAVINQHLQLGPVE